jgi:hypothetical protein
MVVNLAHVCSVWNLKQHQLGRTAEQTALIFAWLDCEVFEQPLQPAFCAVVCYEIPIATFSTERSKASRDHGSSDKMFSTELSVADPVDAAS